MIVDARASVDLTGKGEIETRRYTRGTEKNKRTYDDADVYEVIVHVDDLTLESSSERGNLDVGANTNNIINTILPFDTKNAVKWNASFSGLLVRAASTFHICSHALPNSCCRSRAQRLKTR